MSKKMLMVVASGGEYDSLWSATLVVSHNREKLVQAIEDDKKKRMEDYHFAEKFSMFRVEFHKKNMPEKLGSGPYYQTLPKFPPSQFQITPEQREQRRIIKAENEELRKAWEKEYQAYQETVWYPARREFFLSHGRSEEEITEYIRTDSEEISYEIQEVDFIECGCSLCPKETV
jgi:hypothetical protein